MVLKKLFLLVPKIWSPKLDTRQLSMHMWKVSEINRTQRGVVVNSGSLLCQV